MVPKGWTHCNLGSLLEFKNGINTDAANYGHGTKFVNVMDVFESDSLTHDQIRGSVKITDDQLNTYALKRGDVLFNRTSETREEIAFASVYLDDKPAVFGGFVIRGRPTGGMLDADFSKYCFRAGGIRRELTRRCQGVIRANIGQGDMREISILLPPIEEQKEIAAILDTWDRAIETVDRLIQNSEAQKRTLMQRLLAGKKRYPEFADTKWKSVPLKELCRFDAEPHLGQSTILNGSQTMGAAGFEFLMSLGREPNISKQLISTCRPLGAEKSVEVDPGDLIMSICATIGVPKIVGIPACIHDGFVVFRDISPDLSLEFLYYLLEFYTRQLASSGQPGTQKNLNTTIVGNIKVPTFSRDEQDRIAATLKAADQLIRKRAEWLDHLQRQKTALMQQLLTGKLRVSGDQPKEVARA